MEAHFYPRFLPDNRHFLYMKGAAPGMRSVFVGDLEAAPDAQSNTPILSTDYGVAVAQAGPGAPPMVLFLRDSTLVAQEFDMRALALTASRSRWQIRWQACSTPRSHMSRRPGQERWSIAPSLETIELTWFNRQGDVVGRPGERAPYGNMKVSPDGTRAVVAQNDPRQPGNSDLWIVDLVSGASTRFTFDPGRDEQPVWSPDGRYIAWQAIRGNKPDIYRKSADGSGVDEPLSAPMAANNLTDWTQSGHLIFTMNGDLCNAGESRCHRKPHAGPGRPVAGRRAAYCHQTAAGSHTYRTRPGGRRSSFSHLPPVETR